MPWRCPACHLEIRHHEYAPEPGRIYRCPICHLELQLNARTGRLEMTPFAAEDSSSADDADELMTMERRASVVDRRKDRRGGRRTADR